MTKAESNIYEKFHISREERASSDGRIIYSHNGKRTESSAYEINERAEIHIEIPRKLGARTLKLNLFDEFNNKSAGSVNGVFRDTQKDREVYSFFIPIKKINVGLYRFYSEISAFSDILKDS